MVTIRRLRRDDVPQVSNLYQKTWGISTIPSSESLKLYLDAVLFQNPWYDETMPSLVCQEDDGEIVGFLGVLPRPMSINGRPIRVAVAHSFMVDPDRRASLAGIQLLKNFFSGPQDLSMTDAATAASKRIWEGMGGSSVPLYIIHWRRLLRPIQYSLDFLERKRNRLRPLILGLRPLSWIGDSIVARIPPNRFQRSACPFSREALELQGLLDGISQFSTRESLRPIYEESSLKWLLERAAEKKYFGTLKKEMVRNTSRECVGWYLYYLNPGGISQVLQIGATENSIHEVLSQLFGDAWRHGSLGITGRMEPKFMPQLSENYCPFHCGSNMLVHSRDTEITQAIYRGDAFLTRLEGEWWTCFLEFVKGSAQWQGPTR